MRHLFDRLAVYSTRCLLLKGFYWLPLTEIIAEMNTWGFIYSIDESILENPRIFEPDCIYCNYTLRNYTYLHAKPKVTQLLSLPFANFIEVLRDPNLALVTLLCKLLLIQKFFKWTEGSNIDAGWM